MTHVLVLLALAAVPRPPMQGFDPAKIETVEGTIEKVVGGQRPGGVHLLLKTAKETVEVALGPSWFIDNQEAKLQAGDTVSVRGSRTAAALIAIDVKRGGETLTLRDEDGTPVWAAWRTGSGRRCPGAQN